MRAFSPNGAVMKIVEIVIELEKYKQELKKLKAENELLRDLIQTKQRFEVREDE